MSMPSDTTPDVTEAMERKPITRKASDVSRRTSQMTPEQRGWAVAALVAFLGIAYVGPALTRYNRKPSVRDRMARRLRETQRQARKAGGKVGKRLRRLGGGPIWR